MEEYPSIQAVIDLHRDGVNENTHLVTEINGKPMARFMFFNGLSRTRKMVRSIICTILILKIIWH